MNTGNANLDANANANANVTLPAEDVDIRSAPPKKASWARRITFIAGLVVILVMVAVYFNQKSKLGTQHEVNDKESVYYAGSATQPEAKALGAKLTELGYFDGQRERDVLLRKEDGKTILSFVVQGGTWNDENNVSIFRQLVRELAPSVGGLPVTLRMVDDKIATQKELVVE